MDGEDGDIFAAELLTQGYGVEYVCGLRLPISPPSVVGLAVLKKQLGSRRVLEWLKLMDVEELTSKLGSSRFGSAS